MWLVMLAQLVYTAVVGDPLRKELKGLAAVGLYVGNWSWKFGAIIPDALGHTWSLAVEEQFYLFWPLVLLLLLRRNDRRLTVGIIIGLVALAFGSRLALWDAGVPYNKISVQTEVRLDALMLGALLAFALHHGWQPPCRAVLLGWGGAAVIAAVALLAHREDAWLFEGGYTLVALASVLVILSALDDTTIFGKLLSHRGIRLLGRLSYSIYLWHVFVFLAVVRAWPTGSVAPRLLLGLGLTGLASAVSYHFVEKPFLRLKARNRRALEARLDATEATTAGAR